MDKLFAFAENTRHAVLAIVLLGAVMFLPGLFTIPPIDRDEARFAQASKQMIESGDYLDIRLQDEVRYKKPVGIYWLQTASTHVFGAPPYDQIWTYRVPSVIAAIAALILTYLIGRVLVSAPVGFGAALLLASSLILPVEARLAKTDAVLLATILGAMWILAKAYSRPVDQQTSRSTMIVFWLFIAAGVLVKGPLIVMVVGLAILSLCILEKSPRLFLQLRPVMGIAIVALCAAPWLIAITIKSHGQFWAESVGHDMLGKVGQGQESHGLPVGAHAALLLVLFLPAVVAILRGIFYAAKNCNNRTVQFLLAWILPMWIIFELTPTKLPHYTLPAYPALAILAAMAIGQLNFPIWRKRLAFVFPVLMAVAINGFLLGYLAPRLEDVWLSRALRQQISAMGAEARPLAIVGYAEPSAVFLLGTKTLLLSDEKSAAEWLRANPDGVLMMDADRTDAFAKIARDTNLRLRISGLEQGINLGRGRFQTLWFYEARQ